MACCVSPPHLDVVGLHAGGNDVTDGAQENEIAASCLRIDLMVQRWHPDGPPEQHRPQISDLKHHHQSESRGIH